MPITADILLALLAKIVARYPNAEVKSVIIWPNHWLMFVVNNEIVAKLCVETGEIKWSVK